MNETTADNRPTPVDADTPDADTPDAETLDPLDRIATELDGATELDPAEAVDVLAHITAELNEELDADTDRS